MKVAVVVIVVAGNVEGMKRQQTNEKIVLLVLL